MPASVIVAKGFSCFSPSFVSHLAISLNSLLGSASQSNVPLFKPTTFTFTFVSYETGDLSGALVGIAFRLMRAADSFLIILLKSKVNTSLSPSILTFITLLSTGFVSSAATRLAGLTIEKSMNIDKIIERILFELSMFNSFLI